MENFTGSASAQLMMFFINFCMRDYVAAVRKIDWRKCCPFDLWGGSEESSRQNEMVYISRFLEKEDDLDNTQGGIIPYNSNRNPDGMESDQFRLLSDIYEEFGGATDEENEFSDDMTLAAFIRNCKRNKPVSKEWHGESSKCNELADSANESSQTSDSSSESDDDTDDFTLGAQGTLGKKTPPIKPPRIIGAKRSNPVSAESCGKIAAKRVLRKTTTAHASSEFLSENAETASGAVQESGSTPDDDIVVAEALLDMANGEVETTSEEQALCEHVPPVAVSGLDQDEQIENAISVCVINRNPLEFETDQARKFMWRC